MTIAGYVTFDVGRGNPPLTSAVPVAEVPSMRLLIATDPYAIAAPSAAEIPERTPAPLEFVALPPPPQAVTNAQEIAARNFNVFN